YPYGFPAQVTTISYYGADRYYQKNWVQDANGRKTTFLVGYRTAGTTGDADPNPGDRGSVLNVQDAGYTVNGSPSYQKQYTYTYNANGQKASETNLGVNGTTPGVKTTYSYDPTYGNLTQVVQDDVTGGLKRTITITYDTAGRVTYVRDPNHQPNGTQNHF